MRAKTTHRTAVTVLFFTIVLCLLAAGGCKNASKRAYRAYSGTVSVSLGLGREGILVEEHPFPVTVHVDGDYAKEGKTCVLTVPTNASDYYAYRKPLSEESEQTISFIVPAAKYSSQITIELLDSYERVIYSRTCTYQAYDEWQNMLLAGHMGKQTDTVSWPEQIKRNDLGTAVSVRTVTLTEDNLYIEKEGYGMLDFLSVDVAYFEELSSDVKNALLEWVKEGGTIVFEGSGGWTALQKMNINGFGSSKTFSAGSNQKLLYRSLGDGSVWFLGKTLSQTVSRLTDERKSQFILILAKEQAEATQKILALLVFTKIHRCFTDSGHINHLLRHQRYGYM